MKSLEQAEAKMWKIVREVGTYTIILRSGKKYWMEHASWWNWDVAAFLEDAEECWVYEWTEGRGNWGGKVIPTLYGSMHQDDPDA